MEIINIQKESKSLWAYLERDKTKLKNLQANSKAPKWRVI
jgi:hypothetical protein